MLIDTAKTIIEDLKKVFQEEKIRVKKEGIMINTDQLDTRELLHLSNIARDYETRITTRRSGTGVVVSIA